MQKISIGQKWKNKNHYIGEGYLIVFDIKEGWAKCRAERNTKYPAMNGGVHELPISDLQEYYKQI